MEIFIPIICGVFFGIAYRLVRDWLIVRIFPVQEAKRRTSALKGAGKFWHKIYLSNHKRAEVLKTWVEKHPEHPVVQALLRAETEANILAEQELEDRLKTDREARATESKRRLMWSLENPTNDSARRYLKERLTELRALRSSEEHSVKHYESLLSFYHPEDSERADYQSRLIEAKAELRNIEDSIYEIQLALGVDALDNHQ